MADSTVRAVRKKIVHIEDDTDAIDFIKLALRSNSYDIVSVNRPHRAMDVLREVKPDLVLLDIMMPDINGWEVLHNIRADDALKDTPVIIITARTTRADEIYGKRVAKVDGYLKKPFDYKELQRMVDALLANGRN